MSDRLVLALLTVLTCLDHAAARPVAPEPGTHLRFLALSAKTEVPPAFATVDFVYGPEERPPGRGLGSKAARWWEFAIRTNTDPATPPLGVMRALTTGDPLGDSAPLHFIRYQLRLPETGEAVEYVDARSGEALLPAWLDWEHYFIPHRSSASWPKGGAPQTCELLGQVLSLVQSTNGQRWEPWPELKRLVLDRELLVGTARNFKDLEGHRLPQSPQPQEYTYTNFTAADYQAMFASGINLFTIAPEQQRYVQSEPVFYLRDASGTPGLHYPADFYRANFLGAAMFVDEPASVLTWDQFLGPKLVHFSDAAALTETRTHATFESDRRHYGRYWLGRQLTDLGVNLGDMRLGQMELPAWETFYDMAFYELKGGGSGIVHEGRYRLPDFDAAVERVTGEKRSHSVRELLQWHYAALRGAARACGKSWGTAIYGQCDPAIAPVAFTTAYDMGARYFWFWTSDHGHHVPWSEQLALARSLKDYARAHPRPSIYNPPPKRDTLITIPNGTFVTLANLSWVHTLDSGATSKEASEYRRLLRQAVLAAQECSRRGEDFDLVPDDGRPHPGYRRILRLGE